MSEGSLIFIECDTGFKEPIGAKYVHTNVIQDLRDQ